MAVAVGLGVGVGTGVGVTVGEGVGEGTENVAVSRALLKSAVVVNSTPGVLVCAWLQATNSKRIKTAANKINIFLRKDMALFYQAKGKMASFWMRVS